MFHIGLNRLRISSTLKLLCLLTVIVSTIIILFHQSHHQALSQQDQVSQSRGRISSSSSAWARENRDPSILSRKVKNHQESIPGSSSAGAGSDSRGGGRGGQAAEEEDGDLASAAASLHNGIAYCHLFCLPRHDYAFWTLFSSRGRHPLHAHWET